jgi:uncharacterized peroxidase-related enzyme
MSRIQPVNQETAAPATREFLDSVKKSMGKVPNLVSTLAHSPAAAKAYVGLAQTLSQGVLPPRLREQLALVVGETNSCDYCVAAHSFLGARAGLTEPQVLGARRAEGEDAKSTAALSFARKVVLERGAVSDADVAEVRAAGFGDAEIAEIIAHVGMNTFSNYFNHVAATEIDFPAIAKLAAT